jgi:hypothetical protein
VAGAAVRVRDAQGAHRGALEGDDGVDRLAQGDAGEAPGGAGAEVAGALGHDRHVGVEDVAGGQQAGVQGAGLQVAAEGLAGGHRSHQVVAEAVQSAGEPGRQGAAVGHHVGDPGVRAVRVDAGQDRRQGRVQVGRDDRHAVQAGRRRQHRTVRGRLLVDAEQDRLQRRVAGLDQVARVAVGAGRRRIRGQPVRQGHHQRVATGAQAHHQSPDVQQDAVADFGRTGEGRVGQRPDGAFVGCHVDFAGALPVAPDCGHRS